MPTILDKIVAAKRQAIREAKSRLSEDELRARATDAPAVRDFLGAVAGPGPIRLIAEVKRASPSRGVLRDDFDPVEIARIYEGHGASCISVLTDEPYFQGSLDHLREVRAAVDVPLLRKDFILEGYQLYEARSAGADAVLLIAECLDASDLRSLYAEALELGLTPLVEFYEPKNLPRVLETGARLIGVNNRNLQTFEANLEHTIRMRSEIPDDRVVVGESGIRNRADVQRLADAGVQAVLVGESLITSDNISRAVDELLGR